MKRKRLVQDLWLQRIVFIVLNTYLRNAHIKKNLFMKNIK